MEATLEKAHELSEARPDEAVSLLRSVCLAPGAVDADSLKHKEAAVYALASLLAKQHDAAALKTLLTELAPLFAAVSKAR